MRRDVRTFRLGLACLCAAAPATALAKFVPNPGWGTYYGGTDIDAHGSIRKIVALPDGGVIVAGEGTALGGLATPGAQKSASDDEETFLARFDASGKRLWGTYYGGIGEDYLAVLAVDPRRGVIFVAGSSEADGDMTTPGTHQPERACADAPDDCAEEGFIASFDLEGHRLWGTYFGGTDGDQIHAVAADDGGNVYVCGVTASTSGVATPGSHQPAPEGGNDTFLAKLDGSGALLWATYYAGSICHGIAVDDARDAVYIAGAVDEWEPGGVATPGAHQSALLGSCDAFVARFTGAGERVWGTYYGGSGVDDAMALAVDDKGAVYVLGDTDSADGIASKGAHQGAYGGDGDAFLVKFGADGERKWGTYFGGPDAEEGSSLVTTRSGFGGPVSVYLAMTSWSPGLATSKVPRPNLAGGADAMLVKFAGDGALRWATYHGGSGSEQGHAVGATNNGMLYLGGGTDSIDGIATDGAHQMKSADPVASIGFLARFSEKTLGY